MNPNEWPDKPNIKPQVNDLGYHVFKKDIAWVDAAFKNTRVLIEKHSNSIHINLMQGECHVKLDPRQIPAVIAALQEIADAYKEAIDPPPQAG